MFKNKIIFGLAILNAVIHLIFIWSMDFHRDELLYFSFGSHLSFGYASNPPLIGFLAFVLQNIFGFNLFAAKILPAVLSALMIFLIAGIVKEFGGKMYAQILASVGLIVSPFSLRTFFLFQPVFLDIFFWTLLFLFIIKYINSKNERYLIFIGIVAGFGMLNKYLIALPLIILLTVLAFTTYKQIFKQRTFYIALILAFIIFLPNLIWQFYYDFPVFAHLRELHDKQLVHVSRIGFCIDQLLMTFAVSVLLIAGLLYLLTSKQIKKFRLIGISIALVFVMLFLLKAKSYYTLGVFPVLIAAGAVWFEQSIKFYWLKPSVIVLLILMTIPIVPFSLPVFNVDGLVKYFRNVERRTGIVADRRFEDGVVHSLPQDYADMIGWEKLAVLTNIAVLKMDNKNDYIIYCENYGQAGAVNICGKKIGLPEPVCFSDAFRYWAPGDFKNEIKEFVYINDNLGKDVEQLFGQIEKIGSIDNIHAREFGTTVYLCKKPLTSFNQFWKVRVKDVVVKK